MLKLNRFFLNKRFEITVVTNNADIIGFVVIEDLNRKFTVEDANNNPFGFNISVADFEGLEKDNYFTGAIHPYNQLSDNETTEWLTAIEDWYRFMPSVQIEPQIEPISEIKINSLWDENQLHVIQYLLNLQKNFNRKQLPSASSALNHLVYDSELA